uniref:NADH-ubiquinone oxidoreductase chain 2 n=1 Tax=Phyxioschema suthepium TaxID=1155482 RepID=L7NVX4_9ARAC|nr:NADH dehydrogenase subunit 2 [Phyxioschema suthepium]AFC77869.1 NADH dehydrogenase subunit 2 [Phyxioschema suthepium]
MFAPSVVVFFLVYVMSFVLVVGVEDWMMVWIGLEMNMMSFVGMVLMKGDKGSVESGFSYFFVQSISSILFLVMVFCGGWVEMMLLVSVGAGPFFFWFISVMDGLSWGGCFMLMGFQSVLPLMLASGMIGGVVKVMGLMSVIIGGVGVFGQVSMRKLLAYSSINHLGWILMGMMIGGGLWILYFFVYLVVVGFLIGCLWKWGLMEVKGMSLEEGLVMVILMLSMGGVPPMLGFVGKWMVFEEMVVLDFFSGVVMVIMSLVMIYVYLRVVYEGLSDGGHVGEINEEKNLCWWVVMMVLGSVGLPLIVFLY